MPQPGDEVIMIEFEVAKYVEQGDDSEGPDRQLLDGVATISNA